MSKRIRLQDEVPERLCMWCRKIIIDPKADDNGMYFCRPQHKKFFFEALDGKREPPPGVKILKVESVPTARRPKKSNYWFWNKSK